MFLRPLFDVSTSTQQLVLILNTGLLIAALAIVELVYSETPLAKRRHLKYMLPLFIFLAGLLIYAGYQQAKGA